MARRPAAVVNAALSISGRYPNLGPEIIVEAGIPLVDDAGPDVMTAVQEGTPVRVHEGAVWVGDRVVAKGVELDAEQRRRPPSRAARAGLAVQIESFAANTMDFLRRERELLLDRVGVPEIATAIDGRQVLIVVRGYQYREDLAIAAAVHPGVPAGADRGGRRRRRHPRGGLPARHDRRRHGLGHRPGADLRRRDRRARLPGRPRARAGPGARARARARWCSRRPAPARTSPCCWPTTRAPR